MQIYRYRRVSTITERQQTKWVVFGFSLAIGGFVLLIIIGNFLISPGARNSWVLNGIVEGKIHKLKLMKRMGYGRAGFALLRQRVLHAL
jgi:hypothetical protein